MLGISQVIYAILTGIILVLLMYGPPAKVVMKLQKRYDDKEGDKWRSQLPGAVRDPATGVEAPNVGGPCV